MGSDASDLVEIEREYERMRESIAREKGLDVEDLNVGRSQLEVALGVDGRKPGARKRVVLELYKKRPISCFL